MCRAAYRASAEQYLEQYVYCINMVVVVVVVGF
jgi:hypothetical protein